MGVVARQGPAPSVAKYLRGCKKSIFVIQEHVRSYVVWEVLPELHSEQVTVGRRTRLKRQQYATFRFLAVPSTRHLSALIGE
jgi:hypothetical protein